MTPNLFYDLPNEIVRKIYEYDGTSREKYMDVLDSLPLIERKQLFPGGERWIFVIVTTQHKTKLETRRDAIIDKNTSKALFRFITDAQLEFEEDLARKILNRVARHPQATLEDFLRNSD